VVAHWVEELDLKGVRVSARQGGSDGLGGGAMTRAGVRKKKEEALTSGHDRAW